MLIFFLPVKVGSVLHFATTSSLAFSRSYIFLTRTTCLYRYYTSSSSPVVFWDVPSVYFPVIHVPQPQMAQVCSIDVELISFPVLVQHCQWSPGQTEAQWTRRVSIEDFSFYCRCILLVLFRYTGMKSSSA